MRIIEDSFEYPKDNIGVYAPTYKDLRMVSIPYIESILLELGIRYQLHKTEWWLEIHGKGGAGKIIFRSMDNPSSIIGYEHATAHVDELDTMTRVKAKDAWLKILGRNRTKIYKNGGLFRNPVTAYTTPEGFKFCYDRWVRDKAEGDEYAMIRASSRSNPNLPDDYIPTLEASYPTQLVEAYVDGRFVNLTSGAVYRKYDRVLNGSTETVQGNEPLAIGMDFNVMHGAAAIHVLRDGDPHAVDEIFDAYDTDDQIEIIKQRYPRNPINIYPDATGKKRTSSNTTASDLKKLKIAGFRVITNEGNPPIKDRVNSMNGMICNSKGVRRYRVNVNKAPHVADTLEQQVYGKNGLPDKEGGLDHMGDGAGYYIHRVFPIVSHAAASKAARGGY